MHSTGNILVIVSVCFCLPEVLPLCPFIKHIVSTCSVPSTGGTENGLDTVPALKELTVWWGDRHMDNHKLWQGHVHSLPCFEI